MKNLKIILFIIFIIALIGAAIGFYMYNKPVAETSGITPAFKTTAEIFAKEFQDNPKNANDKYFNNVVEVSGTVGEMETDASGNVNVIINADNATIQFSFSGKANEAAKALKESEKAIIKGKYTGFEEDEIFGGLSIKLNECALAE